MKVAVFFKGISYTDGYIHWSGKNYKVDFRNNIENVIKMIINPYKDGIVDTYYVTYDNEYLHLLKYKLEPKKTKIIPKNKIVLKSRTYVLEQILDCLNLISDQDQYDLLVITRFDINCLFEITKLQYDINKINFLCKANGENKEITYNDDTLIILSGKYLTTFKNAIKQLIYSNALLGHHLLYEKLTKDFRLDINFIYNEVHEIVNSRPYCFFNREVNYYPEYFDINNIKKLPWVKYKINNHVLEFRQDEYHYFKTQYSNSSIIFNIIPEFTSVIIDFDICFISDIPEDNKCILRCNSIQKDIKWRLFAKKNNYMKISEEFSVKRNVNQTIELLFDKSYIGYIKIKNIEIRNGNMPKINFISFYTEGQPYDECINMTESKNKYQDAISPYVDTIKFYTPRELASNPDTEIYIRPFNTKPNPYNPGVHKIGFLRWKPYIILKALESVKDNEIVYYRDGNIIKYPTIVDGCNETRDLINLVLSNTDIFVPIENYPILRMKKNVKREIFEAIGEYNNDYLESYGYNSSIVICRKTELSIKIIREWLEKCMIDELIIYDAKQNQHPEFGWNVQEQSILNVILKKYVSRHELPINFPMFSLNDRLFTFQKLTRVPKIAVLIVGELRNFDNIRVIENNNKFLFDKYNCDVFVSTWNNRGFSFAHGFYNDKKYATDKITEEDIRDVYNNIKGINIENHDIWSCNLDKDMKDLYIKGFYNNFCTKLCPATVFPQLYKLWDANRLKCEYEEKYNFKYDIVIKFRGDMCLIEDIPNLDPYLSISNEKGNNKLYHLNPPNIYEGERIYDIYFHGNSKVMDIIADSWINIIDLINHPYDNKLADINTCRVLYIQALMNNIEVIDIPRAIGDIYRDENFDDYVRKVQGFSGNVPQQQIIQNIETKITRVVISNTQEIIPPNLGILNKCLRGRYNKFLH